MLLRQNIWFTFNVLLILSLLYLSASIYIIWLGIQKNGIEEISYVNKVFTSSVKSTFDQQEIMLELLGQQLMKDNQYLDRSGSSAILDLLLQENKALVGFGLADISGNLIASSSNINLEKMPNLKQNEESSKTFIKTLNARQMVIGRTYYLEALKSWVIPIRKAIHDKNNEVLAVMTAGIRPEHLLPRLNIQKNSIESRSFNNMLIHDDSRRYSYVSVTSEYNSIKELMSQPIPEAVIDIHNKVLVETHQLQISDLKKAMEPLAYFAPSKSGENMLFSVMYLPKYQLWSLSRIPRQYMTQQLFTSVIVYSLLFIVGVSILYFMFRHLVKSDQYNQSRLINQANHDFLTGLHNRLFLKYAEPKWIHENAGKFSVLFIDLDNFKNINDSYGHTFGDVILKEVARRLRHIFPGQSLVCRQGGDEFIILSKKVRKQSLIIAAQKLLNEISRPYKVKNYQFSIGASIGICRYPNDGKSFDALFSAADTAMYKAKSKKNNFFIFTNSLREETMFSSNIEQSLHNALSKNEFHLVYQPQITSKGALYGVEALIRWENDKLGFIPPDQFIHIAEDSGFIIELGHFIINQSIKDIAELNQNNDHFDLQLSINISVKQFLEDGFMNQLSDALATHKFASKQLTLEITESIFIEDFEYMKPLFKELRSLGIKFSLDDFGTGYSSLSMLKNLPIDELKIDKSFIDHITNNRQDRSMVLNIMDIAQNLGLMVVAEGIEMEEQSAILSEYNCDVQQGYYHSKPIQYLELANFCAKF